METQKRPACFLDLPLELQREIFQYFPYWELQKRRGVSRSWCIVTDSINPDYPDAQSQNVRQISIRYFEYDIKEAFIHHSQFKLAEFISWNNKRICYPSDATFLEKNENYKFSVNNVTDFLKWNAKAHYCQGWKYKTNLKGYVKDGKLYRYGCKCCEKCVLLGNNHGNQFSTKCIQQSCAECCTN